MYKVTASTHISYYWSLRFVKISQPTFSLILKFALQKFCGMRGFVSCKLAEFSRSKFECIEKHREFVCFLNN